MFKIIKCTFVLQPLKWLNIALWKTWVFARVIYRVYLSQTGLVLGANELKPYWNSVRHLSYLCVRLSDSFSLLSHSLFLTLKFPLEIFVVPPLGKPYIPSEASTACLGEACPRCWDSFIPPCASCQGVVSNTTHVLPFSHSFVNTDSCDSIKRLGTSLFLYKDLSTSWKHTEVDTWHVCSHGSRAAGVAFG